MWVDGKTWILTFLKTALYLRTTNYKPSELKKGDSVRLIKKMTNRLEMPILYSLNNISGFGGETYDKKKVVIKRGLAFITATFIIVLVTGVFRVYAEKGTADTKEASPAGKHRERHRSSIKRCAL